MQHILVYADSLSWGIIPGTRQRLTFAQRWPGVMENGLNAMGHIARVTENCLNGRRTVWDDPFKPGRNGLQGLAQCVESLSPLSLVILSLGTNDFQSTHAHTVWHSAQGMATLVGAIRQAPIEPGMPVPPILILAPPPMGEARGPIVPKFEGARPRSAGLAAAYQQLAAELGCHFFDAGCVTPSSAVDGIHLDADQHQALGRAMVGVVAALGA